MSQRSFTSVRHTFAFILHFLSAYLLPSLVLSVMVICGDSDMNSMMKFRRMTFESPCMILWLDIWKCGRHSISLQILLLLLLFTQFNFLATFYSEKSVLLYHFAICHWENVNVRNEICKFHCLYFTNRILFGWHHHIQNVWI